MTSVVNLKNEKYDIFIGRPSKWGNPYSHLDDTRAEFKVATRDEAINKYREWILKQPELINSLHELEGKILGCYCRPKRCHGDILIELLSQRNLEAFL
jgi:hypothetical protein